MLTASSVSSAALLKVDIFSVVAPSPPTNWTEGTPVPSNVDISFVLDTLAFSSALYEPTLGADPCLGNFSISNLATSAMSMQSDQGLLWSASNLSSNLSGPNASGGCPGGFFALLGFSEGGNQFTWSFDPSPGISMAVLDASSDPLADLLLGFEIFPGTGEISGSWGTLVIGTNATSTTITTLSTPLPGSYVLFASGLLALAWRRCAARQ